MRLLRARKPDILTPAARQWLEDGDAEWIDDRRVVAYSLGVLVRVNPGARPNLFHAGDWAWRQNDAVGGPISVGQGTWAALAGDGVAWFASFDRAGAGENPAAVRELDEALWKARRAVTRWPETDYFGQMGVSPVAVQCPSSRS